MKNKIFNAIVETVKITLLALAIVIPVRYFMVQPFYVKGASMEPNFYDREYLIVNEISYRFADPQRGDIIIFNSPENNQDRLIKRIVGLPGEKIKITAGRIYIYNSANPAGIVLDEPYLDPETKTYYFNDRTIALAEDEYFVLGDNRLLSRDSRSFGPVKRQTIVGQVFFRGWPLNKIGILADPQFNL